MSRYYVVLEIPVHEDDRLDMYTRTWPSHLKKHIIQSSRKPTGLGF